MSKVTREELEAAYQKEKDHGVGVRILQCTWCIFVK